MYSEECDFSKKLRNFHEKQIEPKFAKILCDFCKIILGKKGFLDLDN